MKAIIPVAGIGSRLRPHTHTQPKSLIPVAGKPILAHIIDELVQQGITDFIFIIGYMGDKIEKYVTTQYPKVKSSFGLTGNKAVLHYEDQSIFMGSSTNQLGNFYAFAAPINKQNSNFQNAPLIVPTLYNMGQNQSKTGINAYTIGENQSLILETVLTKDEAVAIQNNDYSFIPLQQILNAKCKLTFGDYPEKAGNYEVIKDEESLKKISFNFARTESDITAINSGIFDTFTKVNNIATVLNDIASERSSSEIWKWFLFGTLLLLCTELLIQKLIK